MKKQIEDELIHGLLEEHADGDEGGRFMDELRLRLEETDTQSESAARQPRRWSILLAAAGGAIAASLAFYAGTQWAEHQGGVEGGVANPEAKVEGDEAIDQKAKENQFLTEAKARIANGDKAYVERDFEQALADYSAGLKKLERIEQYDAGGLREATEAKYADATVKVAQLRADRGAYTDARGLLDLVLFKDPNHVAATKLLADLDDDDLYNPALTQTHVVDTEYVEKSLQTGFSHYDRGDFENASLHFESILRADPTNQTARRMMAKMDGRWASRPGMIGRLKFNGNNVTKDNVLRREFSLHPGHPAVTPLKSVLNDAGGPYHDDRLVRVGGLDGVRGEWGMGEDRFGLSSDFELEEAGESVATSRYAPLIENDFLDPLHVGAKFSTFAVDVDTASYCNIRGGINAGETIPKDAVRLEEVVNYFDYGYDGPEDEHPFAVHVDSASCPWNEGHRLVQIGLQGKEILKDERPAANLVFLIDVSGSMESSDKLPLVKKSMKKLLKKLDQGDKVSVVVYASASGLVIPTTPVTDKNRGEIIEAIDRLEAGGSTAGGEGIELAYKLAKENFVEGGVNRVILATDGDFNVGISDTGELTDLVKEKAKSGIYLSALGFGRGNLNDAMMESITNNGNGNYFYIDTAEEGAKVLSEDMLGTVVTIAKDVKVQVAFNPRQVKSYRLLGYANRMLEAEDFLDKRVDAGEIGAGHTVTALYEIEPADEDAPLEERTDRTPFEKAPDLKDMKEMVFVKLAYKGPEADTETESTYFQVGAEDSGKAWKDASSDFKFAAASGLFAMVLRESEHRGTGDYKMVKSLAEEGAGEDPRGERREFAELVEILSKRNSEKE